jgi:RNA polymerase sigma-70 factor (ECF subfamily)
MSGTQQLLEKAPSRSVVALRPRLLGLAYRMLGDYDEAEDAVQEAYLRWQSANEDEIRSPEAWLVTVVTRIAVDRLRALRADRINYPGPWLPEPIALEVSMMSAGPPSPNDEVEVASDLSIALLVLLEQLRPEERAAFLLREVFDASYEEISRILERSEDAIRQMVHRARTRVHAGRPRVAVAPGEHERLLDDFRTALAEDDAERVLALLTPDVVLASDGGGKAKAARRQLIGPDRVSRFLLGVTRKSGQHYELTRLNGEPALVVVQGGVVTSAYSIVVDGGRIRAVHIMRNPEKLAHTTRLVAPLV